MEFFSQYILHNISKIFTDGKTIQPFIILIFQNPKVAFHKLI